MRRLLPDSGPTTVERQLAAYRPWQWPHEARPFVAVNFATTVDGRATIGGVSGPIGSRADTAMLAGLRTRFDAVMIGAGTMRAERYGRLISDQHTRERRERLGLPHDPLLVIISGRLDLPWEAPLFTAGGGRVLIFTASEAEPPATATSLRIVRHAGRVDIAEALRQLRQQRGIRALLCEGGPRLHGELESAGLVDELFLTLAPKLAGGEAPRILEGQLPEVAELELAWLLEQNGEMFARYRRHAERPETEHIVTP
ncbi:MAG: dihydrofolate reductase family protein [Solirubrobacterales bacterium]